MHQVWYKGSLVGTISYVAVNFKIIGLWWYATSIIFEFLNTHSFYLKAKSPIGEVPTVLVLW